jgi:hypothetical protein
MPMPMPMPMPVPEMVTAAVAEMVYGVRAAG